MFVGACTVLRLVLAIAFRPATPVPASDWIRAFAVGFHFDLAVAAVLFLPLAVWVGLGSDQRWKGKTHRVLTTAGVFVAWMLLVFMLVAEGWFFEEFRSRYNTDRKSVV